MCSLVLSRLRPPQTAFVDADAEAILLRVRPRPIAVPPSSALPPLSQYAYPVSRCRVCVACGQCIESHLKDKAYDDTKVAGWVNSICEDAMYGLIELGKPFKYIGVWPHMRPPRASANLTFH